MITVLVVDDEVGFRSSLARLLQKRGFEALEADCADTALARIADVGARVELVLADVVLPHTSVLEFADRVKNLWPHVKFLFMSGHSLHILKQEYGIPPDILPIFLQKPFTSGALVARILAVLGEAKLEGPL